MRVRAAPASLAACQLFLARGEEQPVVGPEAELGVELVHVLGAVVLGDRTAELAALARDVAEPGEAFATSTSRSCRRRTCGSSPAVFGAGIARTTPPAPTIFSKMPKPDWVKWCETSVISSGLRRSGLSVPYLSIDSL